MGFLKVSAKNWLRKRFGNIGETLPGEGIPVFEDDIEFFNYFNQIRDITLVSPHRCFWIYQMARHSNNLDGSFAQVGVYKGGTAKLISMVRNPSKSFYLFDTFEGLPKNDPNIDYHEQGEFAAGLDEVLLLFEGDSKVKITKGIFPETAGIIPKPEKFAFVYSDVDLYDSNHAVLNFFYPRMTQGGVIMFDDYEWEHCPGIKKSIDDFLSEHGIKARPIITTRYQAMLIKS